MVTKMIWYIVLTAPAFLFAAWLYVSSPPQADMPVLRTYWKFLINYIAASIFLYAVSIWLILVSGAANFLEDPVTVWLFLFCICVVAFALARTRTQPRARKRTSRIHGLGHSDGSFEKAI